MRLVSHYYGSDTITTVPPHESKSSLDYHLNNTESNVEVVDLDTRRQYYLAQTTEVADLLNKLLQGQVGIVFHIDSEADHYVLL